MNKMTIDLIRDVAPEVERTCEAFAKELEAGHFMRQYELITYSIELEKFLHQAIEKKFIELRSSIFQRK
jgi:hypothetical protein